MYLRGDIAKSIKAKKLITFKLKRVGDYRTNLLIVKEKPVKTLME